MASSSRSINTCANEFCGRIMAVPLPGWKSGDREVDLCYQCFVAFSYNQFCSVYHKTLKGWKTCRSCQKDFHCGCLASSSLYDEKYREFECRGCVAQHANLNYEETIDDTTITPTPRVNCGDSIILTPSDFEDTTITLTPCVNGDTITPTPHAINDTSITPTPYDIDDTTITPTRRVIHETTITLTPCANDATIITPTAHANHNATINPTPRALEQNAREPSSKTRANAQTREKKRQPANRRGKSVPYHYVPRMINLQVEEFQRGRVGENSQIVMGFCEKEIQDHPEVKLLVPLFEKVLTAADTGRSSCLVLPKNCAEFFCPPTNDQETKQIGCQDTKGEDWRFKLRSRRRMYVLDEFDLYVEAMELSLGDTVTFSRLDPERKLIIDYRKNSSESLSNHLPRALIASKSRVRDANESPNVNPDIMAPQVPVGSRKKHKMSVTGNQNPTSPSSASQDKAKGKHIKIGSTSRSAGKKRKISAFDPTLKESTEQEWSPRAPRSSKGKAIVRSSIRPPKKVPSKDMLAAKKIKNITLRTTASSKRTKTRNCECEPQASIEVRVVPEQSYATKKHPRHRIGCECIICIQPPSGSKHSPTCSCRACVAKRLRIQNMAENAGQKPPIQRKRKVPEPTEPSNKQITRVSHGSEENDERRELSPSAEPSNLQAIRVNCDLDETLNKQGLTGSYSNNSIRPLFDLNLPASDDDDDFMDPTHQYTNGYGGYISE